MASSTLRNNCAICGTKDIKKIMSIKDMPVYMGVSEKNDGYLFEDMIFCECANCGNIQLGRLLDPNIVYSHNHNVEIVGELWRTHYFRLLDFIGYAIKDKTILEIGDPSAKIAKLTEIYKKWIIVEKNTHLESTEKIIFKKAFFDDEFYAEEKIDVIIHSHLLEHIYEPIRFFNKCRNILSDDGDIFFSIPNMKFFIDNNYSPNSILQFEHTYYIDAHYVQRICDSAGFRIVKTEYFNNHSVFFHLKKDIAKVRDYDCISLSERFSNLFEIHKSKIDEINEIISEEAAVFIYGAHITSQFYIFNGLNSLKINGVLDGSISKINKYLYGTNLKTFGAEEIIKYDDAVVIVSHMGIYVEEISKQLKSIKNNIRLL